MRLTVALLLVVFGFRAGAQMDEQWRPAFHFTPPSKWMNDPNGLVYHNGKYHLFYQYSPDGIVWGPMHWGHAESTDLLHWNHLPIALYPDSLGWIFSGSAVIDKNNTAGFGKDAMVAIFTYHNDAIWKNGRKNTESQGIAYSLDDGRTWTKYQGNPVLNNSGEKDFRDPKVSWNEHRKCWIMVLAAGDRIKIYSSADLKAWRFESDFIPAVKEPYGVWECPDLFPMNYKGQQLWVLILSQNQNGPNGGSATRYIIGDFDGTSFKALTVPQWIDVGMDYYAAVTYENAPEAKRVLVSWMSNWLYAEKTPTQVWRSAMALPRELTLEKSRWGYFLKQVPVGSFAAQTESISQSKSLTNFHRSNLDLSRAVVSFGIDPGKKVLHVEFGNERGETVRIIVENNLLRLDRSKSGVTGFNAEFARRPQVLNAIDPVTHLQFILDRSSMEISVNGGTKWMTVQLFPRQLYSQIKISSGRISDIEIRSVKP